MQAVKKAASPFPTVVRNKVTRSVDVDMLSVEHGTPFPKTGRVYGKYDDLFAKLRIGSCVACEPSEKETVSNAMRKWLERNGKKARVVSFKRCDDGKARVWMMEAK